MLQKTYLEIENKIKIHCFYASSETSRKLQAKCLSLWPYLFIQLQRADCAFQYMYACMLNIRVNLFLMFFNVYL